MTEKIKGAPQWSTETEYYDLHSKDIFSRFPFYHVGMVGSTADEFVKYIVEAAEISPKSTVVDLGCGSGYLVDKIQDKGCYSLGISTSEECIRQAKLNHQNCNFELGNMETFDAKANVDKPITHFLTLESLCFSDIDKTFRNVFDNLASEGIFYTKEWYIDIYEDEVTQGLRKQWEDFNKYHGYTLLDVIGAGYRAGFELKSVKNLSTMISPEMWGEAAKYHMFSAKDYYLDYKPTPFEVVFMKNSGEVAAAI